MADEDSDIIPDRAIPVGPFEYWSSLGNIDEVRSAIADGNSVNAKSQGSYTAIHGAALNGFQDVVELLIQHGGDPNAKLDSGETPADLARIGGFHDIALFLEQIDDA